MARGGYRGWSHSRLNQITKDNIGSLRLAWVWTMNDGGRASQATPLVHNGILYLYNIDNIIQALDARTGELMWENRIRPSGATGGGTGAMRNIAIYQDKLYVASTDAHMFALDARTGRTVWDTVLGNNAKGFGNSSGPLIINGTIVQGLGGCERYKAAPEDQGCYITGLDAQTGRILWRFDTVAREGQQGGDTWGRLPNMLRAGGDTWITGTYDPDLDLTYWGVAQAKPWMQASRGTTGNDVALYTSATLALRPKTGQLAWHFQHAPGELLDLDEVYERVLVDVDGRKLSFNIGKVGILWKLDRQSGQFLDAKETVFQNVFVWKDRSKGLLQYRPDILEQRTGYWVPSCPGTTGGKDWQTMSYDPTTNLLVIPLTQACMEINAPRRSADRRLGRHDGRSQILRDAGLERQHGQARRLRRAHHGAEMDRRSARRVAHGRADHRVRHHVRRRHQSHVPRLRYGNGQGALERSPRHVGAGLPDLVQRRRQAVHRRADRIGRRVSASRAAHDRARHHTSAARQRALRLHAALSATIATTGTAEASS